MVRIGPVDHGPSFQLCAIGQLLVQYGQFHQHTIGGFAYAALHQLLALHEAEGAGAFDPLQAFDPFGRQVGSRLQHGILQRKRLLCRSRCEQCSGQNNGNEQACEHAFRFKVSEDADPWHTVHPVVGTTALLSADR